MSPTRVVFSVLMVMSAVACGGSARVDGGQAGGAGDGGNAPGGGGSAGNPGAGNSGAGGDGSCSVGNVVHKNHDVWPCDCNTCYCDDGQLSSTLVACFTCRIGDQGYFAGDTFPSPDGCNTCTCQASGDLACTEKACVCDPSAEWSKHYVSTEPKACALLDYICPPNTTAFGNTCGCGCQQDLSCPEWIDCMPGPQPSSCGAQMQKCPYSKVAL